MCPLFNGESVFPPATPPPAPLVARQCLQYSMPLATSSARPHAHKIFRASGAAYSRSIPQHSSQTLLRLSLALTAHATASIETLSGADLGLSGADPDGSGRMDVADFRASLETMNATLAHPHEPLTAQQIVLLADSLPQTADAEIDYLAFMNAFEVVDTTHFEGEGRLEA